MSAETAIEKMLPEKDTIVIASLDKNPTDYFKELLALPEQERPTIICMDARQATVAQAEKWVNDFNSAVDHTDVAELGYVPRTVTIFREGLNPSTAAIFAANQPDTDFIETNDPQSDVISIYLETLKKSLQRMFQNVPASGLNQTPDPTARSIEEVLPPEERAAWRKRLDDLDRWNKGQEGYHSL